MNSFVEAKNEFNRVVKADAHCEIHQLLDLTDEENRKELIELALDVGKILSSRNGSDFMFLPEANTNLFFSSREMLAHVIHHIYGSEGLRIIIDNLESPVDDKKLKTMCVKSNANIIQSTISLLR